MEIPLLNGSNLDTNKKSDIESLITEKSYELYKLCAENGVNCLIITRYIHHHHVFIKNEDKELITKEGGIPITSLSFREFLGMLDYFTRLITQNWLAILPQKPLEGEEWKQG